MKTLIFFLFIFLLPAKAISEDSIQPGLKVFIDCGECSESFLKRNLTGIDHAREPQVSEVHIIVTDQTTGGSGSEFRFQFVGRNLLENIAFELVYNAPANLTEIELQSALLEVFEAGLEPYLYAWGKRKIVDDPDQNGKINAAADPWNRWIFQVSSDFEYSQETSRSEFEFDNEIDVERITDEWRVRIDLEHTFEENRIDRNEGEFISTLNQLYFGGSMVKSLDEHWSAGIFISSWRNTVENIQWGNRLNAALEFNFFPYSMTHIKEFTIGYTIGPRMLNYQQETIFDQSEEQLLSQSLAIHYDQLQTWGRIEADLAGFHYFHDWSKNRFELETNLYLRIVKGLFFKFSAEAQLIHDQLFLPKGDASLEEILLERKALATDFEFNIQFGLSYTFGSLSNNIVNTRL
jgi:hypothetical protein